MRLTLRNNANLSFLKTVDFEAHIAYNAGADVLYMVSKSGSMMKSFMQARGTFLEDVLLSKNLNSIVGAVYNPNDDKVYIADSKTQMVYSVDPLSGITIAVGSAPVRGGDLSIDEEGTLYLATQNGDAIYDLSDISNPEFIGGIPSKVTGIARSNSSMGMVISNYQSSVFTELSTEDASVVTSYNVLLEGEPFTLLYGDLAAGCADEVVASALITNDGGHIVNENAFARDVNSGTLTSQPNPTTGISDVTFEVSKTGYTLIEVYDMNGRNVKTLFNQVAEVGQSYRLNFDGSSLPNGIYIYRLTSSNEIIIDKFIIAK